jgi:hypothetical protein
MRRAYFVPATILLFIAAAVDGVTQAANIKPEKRRSIYLTVKGPEGAAAKIRTLFEEEALKKELFIAEDPHQAGSKVKISISDEHKIEMQLYAELLAATLVPRDGQSSTITFCKQVTDGAGFSTTTMSYWAPTKESAHSTIWIDNHTGARPLAELVRKKISEAGYQMAASLSEADFTLQDIRLVKVPLHVTAMEAKVQSELNSADGSVASLSSVVKNYLPITEPISSEAEGCRKTIEHFGDFSPSGYGEIASLDVALIVGRLKK